MANESGMTEAVVKVRLSELSRLLDRLDVLSQPLKDVMMRQSQHAWSEIHQCAQFDASYSASLGDLQDSLVTMYRQVGVTHKSLLDSAASLTSTDQGVQDRLGAMAKRIEAGPPAKMEICVAEPAGGKDFLDEIEANRNPDLIRPSAGALLVDSTPSWTDRLNGRS